MWQLTLRVLGGRASAPADLTATAPAFYPYCTIRDSSNSISKPVVRGNDHMSPLSTAETLLVTTAVTACFHLSSVLYLGHSSRASQHSESDTGGHGGCWWWGWGDRQ